MDGDTEATEMPESSEDDADSRQCFVGGGEGGKGQKRLLLDRKEGGDDENAKGFAGSWGWYGLCGFKSYDGLTG